MEKFNIKSKNVNYLLRIIRVPELIKHPNADKLLICRIDGNTIITNNTIKSGDMYVYCPLECCLNKEFLSFTNSFQDSSLNKDKSIKNFFSSSGRIRALKLRGSKSEGYVFPLTDLQNWLKEEKSKYFEITDDLVGVEFDYFDDVLINEKYINRQELARLNGEKNSQNRKDKKKARVSKIIDDQFRFHSDTQKLGKFMSEIDPEGLISISYKLHGTSFVVARVLCKKPLKIYEKILKFCGVNIVDTQYDLVYSSRSVIKNSFADKISQSYYDSDIWKIVADKIKDCLPDGISVFGEAVGYTPSGSWIQKGFDYGCEVGKLDYYLYRATYTNTSGRVIEFSWNQLKEFCSKYDIKCVPELYYGKAKDLFNIPTDQHWQENFLKSLSEKYLEKNCHMCKNVVPCEGVVLKKDYGDYAAYKHKSFAFLLRESKELDSGTVDLETQESINSDNIPNEDLNIQP